MKYNVKGFIGAIAIFSMVLSCNNNGTNAPVSNNDSTHVDTTAATYDTTFKTEAEAFSDLQVLRYRTGLRSIKPSAKTTCLLFI